MPRNTLADAVMAKQEKGARAESVTFQWGTRIPGTIQQHRANLELDIFVLLNLNDEARDPQLGIMAANAEVARDLTTRAVWKSQDDPDAVMKRALWEPSTGAVDNIGLVQIKDFFDFENPYATDDINDFTIFDILGRKKKDSASQSKMIETLQCLPGRLTRTNDSRDPFVSARHEYLVESTDLPQRMASSQTRLSFAFLAPLSTYSLPLFFCSESSFAV